MIYDFTDEKQAQDYLSNLHTEYSYQCLREKSPEGCHRLADYYENIQQDYKKAAELYKTTCEEYKYGHSCYKYGNYCVSGKGEEEKDMAAALNYHSKGCDVEYMPACHNAGILCSAGKNKVKKDFLLAYKFFSIGCNKDFHPSCHFLCGLHISGKDGIPKDMNRAFKFAEKACSLGNIHACANVTMMYQKGDGIEKNEELATRYKGKVEYMRKIIKDPGTQIKFGGK